VTVAFLCTAVRHSSFSSCSRRRPPFQPLVHLHPQVADQLEAAVRHVLDQGYRTGDLMSDGMKKIGCSELGEVVVEFLQTA
jgi:Isocitrate/isopropylmalate dehydrogenase